MVKTKRQRPEFGIIPAQERPPTESSIVVVAGPGGTGKSTLLGSMAKEGPTLLVPTLAREVNSWRYQRENVDTIDPPITDDGWRPSLGMTEATAYDRFMELMDQLYEDEHYKVILIDNGTELAEAAWHRALAAQGAASISESPDKFRPYAQIADDMDQAIKAILDLKSAKVPKLVGIAWHVQPPKEDTTETVGGARESVKVKKASADSRAEGIEYEGTVLPMIRGGFRRKLVNLVDVMVFTDLIFQKETVSDGPRRKQVEKPQYMVQVVSTQERLVKLPGPVPDVTHVPNEWAELKKLILA